ncbi:MAG: GTP cyclohydrolase II [Pseudomonadota bacterium]|nr:GTP cyclohydrolase II [Pseudomonadota bacterium]
MNIRIRATSTLPTRFGNFCLQVFTDSDETEYLALSVGTPADDCLVRIHSECATGDIFGSLRCDCRDQLELGLEKISEAGQGLFIYLRGHEGRGIGLVNKIKAYALQDQGQDTVEANVTLGFEPDQRHYGAAIAILRHYGLKRVQLLTNNRLKIEALKQAGILVSRKIALWAATNPHNEHYVSTKQTKMGHMTEGE